MTPMDIIKITHTLLIPAFICFLVWRATVQDFRDFVNALHSPGASILVGYIILLTGIIMMKIMLYDDGKYIVGAGAGILAKSLTGTENANPEGNNKTVTTTNSQTVIDRQGDTPS